jgi:hypothetical protein
MTLVRPILAFVLAGMAACVAAPPTERRSSTAIQTDPRPPEDTNLIPPPVPAPDSSTIIRR